jgi:hypothetical protein
MSEKGGMTPRANDFGKEFQPHRIRTPDEDPHSGTNFAELMATRVKALPQVPEDKTVTFSPGSKSGDNDSTTDSSVSMSSVSGPRLLLVDDNSINLKV